MIAQFVMITATLTTRQFLTDLERGKTEETKVFNYYKKRYSKAEHISGYEKKYDILIPEEKFCIEVKFDDRSNTTGNYFIEAFCENKESGINATTAKLWVISNGSKYLFVNTKDIKNCIKNLELKNIILFGKKVQFYLVKKVMLEKYGVFVNLD